MQLCVKKVKLVHLPSKVCDVGTNAFLLKERPLIAIEPAFSVRVMCATYSLVLKERHKSLICTLLKTVRLKGCVTSKILIGRPT